MKNFSCIIPFVTAVTIAYANNGDYAVSKISQTLLKNANAVLRYEDLQFEIVNPKETIETNHYVITVLNENGDDWADFSEYYNKFREINSVEGYLYDADGKELKKMKFKDLKDLSGTGESSLIDDIRIKTHNFYYKVYPYTIEYTVEIHHHQTMFFPSWVPQSGEKLSVESSQFTVICPGDYQFRYKAFNYAGQPVTANEKNKNVTRWIVKDMPALIRESFGPDWHDITTMVMTAPTNFQFGDYKGSMSSWQDLGKFQFALNQGRDNLPENVKQEIHRLSDSITDARRKIQVLYEYMQKNTRYISVQLGIGGWQPFDATYVATKGYGDCKALSNYMHSILKEAGIRSDYTLIRSGENGGYLTFDFPSRQFDHAILSVPLEKDTVWLECTSQDLPAGYLGGFTANRFALAVDENGGKLVHTPRYGLADNVEVRKAKAVLSDDASLEIQVYTSYRGLDQDEIHGVINSYSKDKVKEYLQKELDFPTYELRTFEYKETKSSIPEVNEQLDLNVSNYASITGKRLFIIPNIMTRSNTKLKSDEERKYDIVLHEEDKQVDSTEIEIPKGYEQESLPQPVSIETKFGRYYSNTKLVDNRILYYRTREQYSGTFSAKDYPDLVKFYDAIYKADRNKIVLVRKESN